MTEMTKALPQAPVCLQRFIQLLGVHTTMDLVLNFGGAEVYAGSALSGNGMLERVIGPEKAILLQDASDDLNFRVPLANKWLAQCLHVQGLSAAAIARRIRVSDVTVRKYIAEMGDD